ncbi:MAG TPA: uroporphyrinogen-III synthase [Polyangiales bacterium]|nr:uroporphyrinogen-III synthase [Polyangiales bacterium]
MSEQPLRVVSLESRKSQEMRSLLERHGCTAISAPSMREIPLSDQHEALAFGDELLRDEHAVIVLLTGVGTRMLVDALSTKHDQAAVLAALGRAKLVCRGPKPVAALKALGLKPTLVAPEPNTWNDVLALLDAQLPVAGQSVAVQAYGRLNEPLLDGLKARGATVRSVAIYAWALPVDTTPLTAAIEQICSGSVDVVLFTAAQQLAHLFQVAEQSGRQSALSDALKNKVVCASIGPVMTEALQAQGLPADIEPEHPKMGHLVQAVARKAAELAARKRS